MSVYTSVVVIPVYRIPSNGDELASLRTTVGKLISHDIVMVCPASLVGELEDFIAQDFPSVGLVSFNDRYFKSIRGYNRLMLSISFYQRFARYRYLLIAQLDALVFGTSESLFEFENLGFSYIGAPWFEPLNGIPGAKTRFAGVGNGGLSLRRVDSMISLLRSYRIGTIRSGEMVYIYRSSSSKLKGILKALIAWFGLATRIPVVNEDKFICRVLAASYPGFRLPPVELAATFAFEENPEELLKLTGGQTPFGCHAWRKYDSAFWSELNVASEIINPSE